MYWGTVSGSRTGFCSPHSLHNQTSHICCWWCCRSTLESEPYISQGLEQASTGVEVQLLNIEIIEVNHVFEYHCTNLTNFTIVYLTSRAGSLTGFLRPKVIIVSLTTTIHKHLALLAGWVVVIAGHAALTWAGHWEQIASILLRQNYK